MLRGTVLEQSQPNLHQPERIKSMASTVEDNEEHMDQVLRECKGQRNWNLKKKQTRWKKMVKHAGDELKLLKLWK